VTKDYDEAHPKCLDAIHATIEAINTAPISDMISAFGVCEAKGLGPDLPSELFQYSLENIPQQDYPYPIGNNPAWPVNATCAILVTALAESESNGDAKALIAAAVNVTDTQVGTHSTSACFPTLGEGPGSVPGDGPGPGNWGFQSCTENLHMFSARSPIGSPSGIRDFKFNLTKISDMCNGIFGVRPDPMALAKRYGGFKLGDGLAGVSNLIWSNGALDPWHGGGFLKPGDPSTGNHWILMQKGAHHLDLRAPNPADPAEVTAARVLEASIIGGWIKDASQP
jgi:lysosomal Pro-X carboxypeptidase